MTTHDILSKRNIRKLWEDMERTPTPAWCTYTATAYTYYVLGQGQVLAEQSSVSPTSAKYKFIYAGHSWIAMRDATQKLHYFLNDHLGSTRAVIDSTGLVKDKYWYYAFGETRNEQVSTNQSYRYTSKPLDKEGGINIYYYGARYYDPELGRFMPPTRSRMGLRGNSVGPPSG
jgi:RHS repeat-associated protein